MRREYRATAGVQALGAKSLAVTPPQGDGSHADTRRLAAMRAPTRPAYDPEAIGEPRYGSAPGP